MSEIIEEYLQKIAGKLDSGQAREHAYRSALEDLLEKTSGLSVVNDPKRSEYGSPDFIFLKGTIPVAYAETKDIGVSLDKTEKGEQMVRYYGYSNLILTDYLEFRFYRNGERYCEPIVVAKAEQSKLTTRPENFQMLEDTLKDFIGEAREPIKSGAVLAKVMAGKARRIRDNVRAFLAAGDTDKNKDLIGVREVMRKLLLADLDDERFADMYAQTVVYGLFVARYSDETKDTFSRGEARELIPASNPFLRKFFDHVAGESFDRRLEIIVNELCEEFTHADVRAVVHDYYKVHKDKSRDPIIHFYEDFLKSYNSKERLALGVFYTPLPVVRFIIRAVDAILKHDFDFEHGLGHTGRTEIKRLVASNSTKTFKDNVHQLQILDPATGTGTFLNETILHIHETFKGQEGRWPSYVLEELLPRLHGFEIMMAPYTIAHLKLATTLKETGVKLPDNSRIGVYLTNSVEPSERPADNLLDYLVGLGKAVAEESAQAARIKEEMPIMAVVGNPPYNVSSQNRGAWITDLIKDYKEGLNEKKINLDDDYIKFIRLAQYLVEKNAAGGIVGFITNNSYLDGITHRQMRRRLLEAFDDIYVLDLHGSAKKQEKALDGGKDENVFDIQQGVSIVLFVRRPRDKKKKNLGKIFHAEIFGVRHEKYEYLEQTAFDRVAWKQLAPTEPYFFFVPKDFSSEKEYEKGFKVDELFVEYNSGIQTKRDGLLYQFDSSGIQRIVDDFSSLTIEDLRTKYELPPDGRDWTVKFAKDDVQKGEGSFVPALYHPFDLRSTWYSGKTKGLMAYPRSPLMKEMLKKNLALVVVRNSRRGNVNNVFVSNTILDKDAISPFDNSRFFPLYLEEGSRKPNFNKEIEAKIKKHADQATPEDIFDYIYAILHAKNYCEKYKEFLKIDFPRIPYPKDKKQFMSLASLGGELRALHLLESSRVNQFITSYPKEGANLVEKIVYKDGKTFINAEQYFGGVPEAAWFFWIGGYQPAQKWLKDRKGRTLTNTEIEHYQKIIVSLVETERIMKEIDKLM